MDTHNDLLISTFEKIIERLNAVEQKIEGVEQRVEDQLVSFRTSLKGHEKIETTLRSESKLTMTAVKKHIDDTKAIINNFKDFPKLSSGCLSINMIPYLTIEGNIIDFFESGQIMKLQTFVQSDIQFIEVNLRILSESTNKYIVEITSNLYFAMIDRLNTILQKQGFVLNSDQQHGTCIVDKITDYVIDGSKITKLVITGLKFNDKNEIDILISV
ncbi:hypothetical protein TetV_185 [Tetraselmis virus 1]|uniref:Uncharacterized protein n=1 Tax=Tetraselmis virus 1 TaxID=2060617 RepID=A0A2P0VMZ1_9VIRU|nr:hypothetical protein QJ968_gp185 [Tetraselmis virus 1]AUF82277.1 hypothetical protein TetV_185 [Tetraselmis virus 1]